MSTDAHARPEALKAAPAGRPRLATRIRTWSIRTRLLLAFVGVLIPYLALASIGAAGFRAVWAHIRAIEHEALVELDLA